ncbi:hypothetical protein GJ744_003546 [Endocarpon pusillum]|uniref:LIM zinc-binding domain-containing protein n=1 Tax=Endocarpon pusillum TaxID=364733 RepID=A0A8H7AMA4_9EURO|nr:hypothetical protein GJ744_003546 [Endocarpon pusillum]
MAAAPRAGSFLPAIKCSNCALEIEVSMMGDHVCPAASHVNSNNGFDAAPPAVSQRDRSFSRSGPRLRVDSSAANRTFVRPNELTPASSDTASPINGSNGRKSPFNISERSPIAYPPQGPPSPEYTNLDCAFPPFPITAPRSATPVQQPLNSDSRFGSEYVREHAEPYNQSRPTSPSIPQHSRTRSMLSTGSRNRSGTMGNRPEILTRSATSDGRRKPSLASISGGPKTGKKQPPPLPDTAFVSAAPLAAPEARRAGFLGLRPNPSRGEALMDQPSQRRPLSPNRSQTFPPRNEVRMLGNSSNNFISRRPSEPSSVGLGGRPPVASETTHQAYIPPNQSSISQQLPGMYPPRTASRNSNRPVPRNRPYPVRTTSRTDIKFDFATSSRPPLPAQHVINDLDPANPSHMSSESSSSYASSTSMAQSGSSHASPATKNITLARELSEIKHENNAAHTPPPDLALPPQPALPSIPPDSPTDPFCLQGCLSPIPQVSRNRPPFSTASSSTVSGRASSRYLSSRELPNRRGTRGGKKGICRGCSQPIMAGQKSISSKDGRLSGRYHKQCFACHTCHGPFETADFYVHDDHPFCSEHYHALNGSLCTGCGKGIEGQYLEATKTNGKEAEKFHPQCLTCSTCCVSLRDDYFEWMGKAYCERDAKLAAGVPIQAPDDAFLPPRPSSSPRPALSSDITPPARHGLPAGPRAGLRQSGPGPTVGPGNAFLFPFPPNAGTPAAASGGRFPERRTTRLIMM